MDELANKVIDDHHRIQFLLDQFRGFAAEQGQDLSSQGRALMGFYFIEGNFNIPAFMVMEHQFFRAYLRIEKR